MDLTKVMPKFPDDVTVKELHAIAEPDGGVRIEALVVLYTIKPAPKPALAASARSAVMGRTRGRPKGAPNTTNQRAVALVTWLREHGGSGVSTDMVKDLGWTYDAFRRTIDYARKSGTVRLVGTDKGRRRYALTDKSDAPKKP